MSKLLKALRVAGDDGLIFKLFVKSFGVTNRLVDILFTFLFNVNLNFTL